MSLAAAVLTLALAAPGGPPADGGERHVVVVSGIGGEAHYRDLFHRWGTSAVDVARDRLGIARERVVYLAEKPDHDPDRIDGAATRESVVAALGRVAEASRPGDVVLLLLIGHGTARPGRILFNLPGPDLSAEALSETLDRLAGRTVVVVNAASSSGPFVQALSGPGRVIVTATANAAENHHPKFGGYFVAALAGGAADRDKDGRVSVLEAFAFAAREVAASYEGQKRLATEHALLDDDGDGIGSREPGGDRGDGALAAQVFLGRTADAGEEQLVLDAAARALVERIEALKRRRRELTREALHDALEPLLVELALNRRARRAALP